MDELQTHVGISSELCGELSSLAPGRSAARLTITAPMQADSSGLAHGGFIFGLADYAAMAAVNHPNVVLGSAESRFIKPARVGDTLEAEAAVREEAGKKRIVDVVVRRGETEMFTGRFTCFVLDNHVLAE